MTDEEDNHGKQLCVCVCVYERGKKDEIGRILVRFRFKVWRWFTLSWTMGSSYCSGRTLTPEYSVQGPMDVNIFVDGVFLDATSFIYLFL